MIYSGLNYDRVVPLRDVNQKSVIAECRVVARFHSGRPCGSGSRRLTATVHRVVGQRGGIGKAFPGPV